VLFARPMLVIVTTALQPLEWIALPIMLQIVFIATQDGR
jgi:hypothetical protein